MTRVLCSIPVSVLVAALIGIPTGKAVGQERLAFIVAKEEGNLSAARALRGALAERGFRVGQVAAAAVKQHLGQPLSPPPKGVAAAITAAATSAVEHYREGAPKQAIAAADRALQLMESQPQFTIDPALSTHRKSALLVKATSLLQRGNHTQAAAVMRTYQTAFPQPLSKVWPPGTRRLQKRVQAASKSVVLKVSTGTTTATIRVDGRDVGTGVSDVAVAPGPHWVTIDRKRVWRVNVGETGTQLVVPWRLAQLKSPEPGVWVGAAVPIDERLSRQLALATKAEVALIFPYGENDAKTLLIGTDGRVIRRGSLSDFDEHRNAKVQRFADYLLTGAEAPSVADTAPRPYKTWKWVTGGVGVAALGTGVALILIHDEGADTPGMPRRDGRSTRIPGIVTAGAGAALTGWAVYMFLADAEDRAKQDSIAIVPLVTPETVGVGVGWTW